MYWDTSLETSIPIVDQQHKEMFKQLDVLLDYTNTERIAETLAFLSEYVVKHFGTEELMQKSARYPLAATHKKEHDAFIQNYLELKHEYEMSGEDSLVLNKLLKMILEWLHKHIMGLDKDFAIYFKNYCHDSRRQSSEVEDTQVLY
ncbi:MAG: hemerythrin family protein [Parabacteroides sp.]|nr:hemerythrin family protein [Parabacteroides sp.]